MSGLQKIQAALRFIRHGISAGLYQSQVRAFIKRMMILLLAAAAAGCAKKLPDPQVIYNPTKPLPSPTASPTPTIPPTPTLTPLPTASPLPEPTEGPDIIRYTVPPLSQDGLLLDGVPTGVGCVPVCIEMITAWWNSISPAYSVLSAQETIDRNAPQGLYVAGRGMTSASAADELAEIGYIHHMEINSSKEALLEAFEAHGPIGVLVKTNWIPTTMNHAAVLTSYDPKTDTVTLNDPLYGAEVSWNWDAFDGIWGLNYAGDRDYNGSVVRRVFFTIYPAGWQGLASGLIN